jgi:nucleoside-diphosphate-sugar epimerase
MAKEYVLITGATGFIGSHVTERLLSDKSYGVVAIVRRNANYKNVKELEHKGVMLVEGSFCDKTFLDRIFEEFPVQNVIHIAALRGAGTGTSRDYYRVNVLGTELMLQASLKHQIKKFIFCSSVGVYGTIPQQLPANLTTGLKPDNAYHTSKFLAEKKVSDFTKKGLNAYIIRPTITYGIGDNGFPSALVNMVRKKGLLLPFKDTKIHLLDVNRFADVFIRILITDNPKHRVLLVGDKEPVLLRELTNLIYHYHHNKDYPSFLKLPNFMFNSMLFIFQAVNNEKWSTRIQLISKNWHYDVEKTGYSIGLNLSDTKQEFLKFLQTSA